MNTNLPPTAQREALNADITTTRAELGQTLEAIAAETQVKTRAKEAARETAVEMKHKISDGTAKARAEAASWWHRFRGLPARQRLSVAAVLAGMLSTVPAFVGFRRKGGRRS